MRILEILLIVVVILALFGPKTLQSLSGRAGKTVKGVKTAKDNFMSHVPADDLSKMHKTLKSVPTNPRQAFQILLSSEQRKEATAVPSVPVPTTESRALPKEQ